MPCVGGLATGFEAGGAEAADGHAFTCTAGGVQNVSGFTMCGYPSLMTASTPVCKQITSPSLAHTDLGVGTGPGLQVHVFVVEHGTGSPSRVAMLAYPLVISAHKLPLEAETHTIAPSGQRDPVVAKGGAIGGGVMVAEGGEVEYDWNMGHPREWLNVRDEEDVGAGGGEEELGMNILRASE